MKLPIVDGTGKASGTLSQQAVSSKSDERSAVEWSQSGIGIAEVLVIVEMVFTITKSTFALAAVSEFECRVGLVGRTTDDAFVPRFSRVGANLSLLLNSSAFRP